MPGRNESNRATPDNTYHTEVVDRNIHILGTGSIGKLVAHSLLSLDNAPPVTLCLHRPSLFDEYEQAGRSVTITKNDVADTKDGLLLELTLPERKDLGFEWNVPRDRDKPKFDKKKSEKPIHNLIVTVKASQVVSALNSVKSRVSTDTTILFLQNGMGIVEEVNQKVFPDKESRPNFLLGVNSHGAYATGATTAVHAGMGTVNIGMVPRIPLEDASADPNDNPKIWAGTSRYLMGEVCRAPALASVPVTPSALLQAQLEKLVANCIINPLTVLYDSKNGMMLDNFNLLRVVRLMIAEISAVIQKLPELQGIPNIKSRFSPKRLEDYVMDISEKTRNNISSMLQDARRGQELEIPYINGYIVKRGEELGISPVINYAIWRLVEGKQLMINREIRDQTPMTGFSGHESKL